MVALPEYFDPTLEAMRRACEERAAAEPARRYIGASSIGDPCARKIWYGFHGYPAEPIPSTGLFAIEDGHRSEELIASRLRLVPGVELWTHKDDGTQWGFEDGDFKGHIDGVVRGLVQQPVTPSIWENKAVNERKFKEFQKAKATFGEKLALRNFDVVWHAQAQIYMRYFSLTRHYLTVCTPGGRDVDSCRTECDPILAEALVQKARRIASAKEPPEKIGKADFYLCRMCRFRGSCHGA
ncbi:hypothetical protein [Roseicella sp. DB1501]|uniref:hypothetical protein n=1 Tax=Roseicella sp. DB1501 TaxID=2730925 RepID=UPI0014908F37|nr:hypothetical protein [Roseicella sp. DB1501]NOG73737.1 hypothetical protein [Roseicella sp. DB1501]